MGPLAGHSEGKGQYVVLIIWFLVDHYSILFLTPV